DLWMIEVNGKKVDATEQIMSLLRNDRLRGFRVDIETDSTVQPDAVEEQRNRVEFVMMVEKLIAGAGPALQSGLMPPDVLKEFISFGARGFKMSPQLEEALDKLGGGDQDKALKQDAMMKQKMAQEVVMAAEIGAKQAETAEAQAKAKEAAAKAQEAEAKALMTVAQAQAMGIVVPGAPMVNTVPQMTNAIEQPA